MNIVLSLQLIMSKRMSACFSLWCVLVPGLDFLKRTWESCLGSYGCAFLLLLPLALPVVVVAAAVSLPLVAIALVYVNSSALQGRFHSGSGTFTLPDLPPMPLQPAQGRHRSRKQQRRRGLCRRRGIIAGISKAHYIYHFQHQRMVGLKCFLVFAGIE